jgi:hypothetical protein
MELHREAGECQKGEADSQQDMLDYLVPVESDDILV